MSAHSTIGDSWASFEEEFQYAQQRQAAREERAVTGRRIDEGDFAAWNLKWQAARDSKVLQAQQQQTESEFAQVEMPSHEESERYLQAAAVPYHCLLYTSPSPRDS